MKGQNEILIGAIVILILAAAIAIQFQTSTPTGYASPPLPTNLTAGPGTNVGEIIVSWDLSAGATNYKLDAEEAGRITYINTYIPPIRNTTPLPPGEASAIHRYRIKACNFNGCTPTWSAWVYGDPKIDANASGPYTGSIGTPITLNATGSYIIQARDVAGYPTYSWSLTNNTANCSLSNSTIKNPTVTCSSGGTTNAIVTITTFYSNDTAVSAPATITIADPADTPPTVINSSPVNGTVFSAGTTSTYISVATNENATCRYSTNAGTAYASMPNTFTIATGATSHLTLVSGFQNGQTYNYYVRCQDTAGNTSTSDYVISFSVAAGDTTPPTAIIDFPSNGAIVSGTVNVQATANDNVAVQNVKFLVDGILKFTDPSSPYAFSWDTTTVADGNHVVKAIATDTSNNVSAQAFIVVTVNNAASCTENWSCTSWSACNNATQTRTCTDNNNCGTTTSKPSESQSCSTCTNGQTQNCTTSQNCLGTQTCVNNSWSSCIDYPNDNCPVSGECILDSDCFSVYPKEKCDTAAKKHFTRSVTCNSLSECNTGSWIDSGRYCSACFPCGDGELNCNETCSSCEEDCDIIDEPPVSPTGLTVFEKTETSITIRWNPNEETDLKRYVIYYGTSSGNHTSQKIALADEVELTITNLQKATTYFIALKAVDLAGNTSPYSNEVTALTKGTIEPDCSENNVCNELCDSDPDCTTKKCIEDGNCDKNCTTDPDCEIPPEDNTVYWGIGTAIVVIAGALAYVFYHSGV